MVGDEWTYEDFQTDNQVEVLLFVCYIVAFVSCCFVETARHAGAKRMELLGLEPRSNQDPICLKPSRKYANDL
jgi:hypothetical protein